MSLCKELGDHSNVCICVYCDVCEGTDDYDVSTRYSAYIVGGGWNPNKLAVLCPHDLFAVAQIYSLDEGLAFPRVVSVIE
ncbi:hypothetical protein LCGC14_2216310 [marine sediment metagenome]|uniref:Uncharacterized protein n=1 Tax=marine sediment metagenome TaxID=412755 RepID=A0A0F9G7Y5_9ZZZZ